MAEVVAHQTGVLFFHEPVVIFVPRAAAGDEDIRHLVSPESLGLVIEQGEVVIRVDLADGEGQTIKDTSEGIFDNAVTTTQDGHQFAPAGGHVDHLEGIDEFA